MVSFLGSTIDANVVAIPYTWEIIETRNHQELSEKKGLYNAIDIGEIWLKRALKQATEE